MAKSMADFGTQARAVFKTMSAGKMISLTVLVVATAALTALLEWPAPKLVPLLLLLAVMFVGINLVVDLLYMIIDPRIGL